MKTYLITGVMGFVGSHWAENLLSKGEKVIGIDIHQDFKDLNKYKNFSFFKETIVDNKERLYSLIKDSDYVLHLASIAEPAQYITHPKKIIQIAALAAIDIIDICAKLKKRLFFTSTSEVYGKNPKIPFRENDDRVLGSTTTKRWCYSSSKALVEHYLEACVSQDNVDYRAARLFNVYGPRLKGRVVAYFLKNSLQNKDLDINGTGKQTRCFTYIDDVIEAFNLILHADNCKNQIFNIGSNDEISIEEFAKKIIKITKSKSKLRKVSYNEQFGKSYEDIDRRVPDISKIENYVNWKPKTSLEDGINLTLKLEFKN
tara:strand:+ start:918 stop:1862 length:945 start_codon:yes stop_codon:yes gene_type:complete